VSRLKHHDPKYTQPRVQRDALHPGIVSSPHTYHTFLGSQITLNSLDGPRKDDIGSLQKQIDYHFGEIYRLKHAQNSRVPIFCLPAKLLSQVYLYVTMAGIQYGNAKFATGTFNSPQVCRHWNEVAVMFPQLWVWLRVLQNRGTYSSLVQKTPHCYWPGDLSSLTPCETS